MNIWAILWVCLLIFVFIGTYILNQRTPKPKGCEKIDGCEGCANLACSHHEVHHKEEKK